MDKLEKYITSRKSHAKNRVDNFKESHGDNPGKTHTYHGGWSLGYWEGKLSVYEDISDLITEDEETNKYKEALEKIVTRSMSMYATKEDMLRDIIEIAWRGLGK